MVTRPIQTRRGSGPPKGCLALFFLIFFAAGAAGAWFLLWRPVSRLVASRSWTEMECTVLSSQVATVSGSDGDTYKIDIHYTWTLGGRIYESNRYDFMIGSSSGTQGKQAVVDRYPPGARVPCWIDPADPSSAVLSRGLSPVYLIGLVPVLFLAVGLIGLIWTARPGRSSLAIAGGDESPFGVPLAALAAAGGPAELKPAATPLGMLLGLLFVALFWNGIVSVFVWQAVSMWRQGQPSTFLNLFLIPFVGIGLLLLFAVAKQLLVLFNPRPYLTLTPGVPATGESAFLQWRLGSGGRGVARIRISLEGREEARYRRGTSNYTDRDAFLTLPIVDSAQPVEIAAGGSAGFRIPAGTLPTFRAEHNKIVWTLKVNCELPRWPDTEEEYEVVVRPGRST
jgi:hypothetical protein